MITVLQFAKMAGLLCCLASESSVAAGNNAAYLPEPHESSTPILAMSEQSSPLNDVGDGDFRYSAGKFVQRGNRRWTEHRDNGPSSHFKEKRRNSSFVELYDADRDLLVRLYENEGKFFDKALSRWVKWPGSEGRWTDR